MQYGAHEERLKKLADRGRSGPARVLGNKPYLYKHNIPIWQAFQRLDTCRSMGPTAPGRIWWSAVDRYAERHGYADGEYDHFVECIESLDRLSLAEMLRKSKIASKSGAK